MIQLIVADLGRTRSLLLARNLLAEHREHRTGNSSNSSLFMVKHIAPCSNQTRSFLRKRDKFTGGSIIPLSLWAYLSVEPKAERKTTYSHPITFQSNIIGREYRIPCFQQYNGRQPTTSSSSAASTISASVISSQTSQTPLDAKKFYHGRTGSFAKIRQ